MTEVWLVAAILTLPACTTQTGQEDASTTASTGSASTTEATTTTRATNTSAGEVVKGWPDTNTNSAGLYSWDGSDCAGASCTIGFMHNGYGSGDVEIQFHRTGSEPITDDRATAVTIGGRDAVHRRISDEKEDWTVDIEGKMFSISLTAEPGTSQADLDEAHAIIDSIRTEPSDNTLGFRLVFTLTTDDWDSG